MTDAQQYDFDKDTAFRIAIRMTLHQQGKSEYQMAKGLGKHPTTFGASLNKRPLLPTVQQYAKYLGMTTAQLVELVETLEKRFQ